MSLASIRPFFRARLNALGLKEHSDAFDDANRPQQTLEKLYRLQSGPATSGPANSSVHSFTVPISLVITLRGKLDNVALSDRAWAVSDEILADILQESVRIGTIIKDIIPDNIEVSQYNDSDDNDCILTIGFTVKIICRF